MDAAHSRRRESGHGPRVAAVTAQDQAQPCHTSGRRSSAGAEAWTAHDRAGWTGSVWQDAFPDRAIRNVSLVAYGDQAVLEGTSEGTQTAPLRTPAGEIPATGRTVIVLNTVDDGLFTSFRLYFDQLDFPN